MVLGSRPPLAGELVHNPPRDHRDLEPNDLDSPAPVRANLERPLVRLRAAGDSKGDETDELDAPKCHDAHLPANTNYAPYHT